MKQYLDLGRAILEKGSLKTDRTGTGTISLFGYQSHYNLLEGFPLVTTKKIHLKSVIHELLWKLSGDTNIAYLHKHGVTIWDEWADENGDVGRVYGYQMRHWNGELDQVSYLVDQIKKNPDSRRLIMTLWNPSDLQYQKLPPCPCFYQFEVHDNLLSLQVYQRSCDYFLGVPFNIAQDSLLLMMMAQVTGLTPYMFIHTYGDVHIYSNHTEQVNLQLTREPRPLPRMELNPTVSTIFDFKYEDFTLTGYDPHPHIKGDVAV